MHVLKYKNEFSHLTYLMYNTTIKTYANGEKVLKYHNYNHIVGRPQKKGVGSGLSEEEKSRLKYKHLLEVKQKIIDLIYHNGLIKPWEYFITLTFDDSKINGYDYNAVRKALDNWLDSQKHQNPGLEYVIVPEYHKSKRIHFHGVVRGVEKWRLLPSYTKSGRVRKINGVQIFNLDNYKYGFTTISKIQDKEAVAVYTSKYITKEFIDVKNAKKYWSSKSLEKPSIEYAHFNEETLSFWINKEKKDYYENDHTIIFKTLN